MAQRRYRLHFLDSVFRFTVNWSLPTWGWIAFAAVFFEVLGTMFISLLGLFIVTILILLGLMLVARVTLGE